MPDLTNPPAGGVEPAPSSEERMMRFLQQREEPQDVQQEEPVQTEAPVEAQQPEDSAVTEELTPEDIPDETPQATQSAVDEFEIVHNGQQRKLSREETIRLAQQGFDYTQKTQELAEQRKQVQQALQKSNEVMQLAPLISQDLATVKALESQLSQYQNVDWVSLASNDPLEYPKHQAQFDKLRTAYNQAVHQFQQKTAHLEYRQQELRAEELQREFPKMIEKIPEWRDPAKYEAGAKELWSYLGSEGVPTEVLRNLSDATYVAIARKAMLYDKLVKSKAEKVKLARTAPPVSRPGTPQSQSSAQAERIRDTEGKFKKSGDIRDATQVLLNRWRVK